MVDGLFLCATFTGRRAGHIQFVKHERKHPTLVRKRLSWTQALLGRVAQGAGSGVGDENMESCGVVRPLRIPLVIHPVRHSSQGIADGGDGKAGASTAAPDRSAVGLLRG